MGLRTSRGATGGDSWRGLRAGPRIRRHSRHPGLARQRRNTSKANWHEAAQMSRQIHQAPVPRVPSKSPYRFQEKVRMALWWLVESTLFRTSPHKLNRFRCQILRWFGAEVGRNTFIHSSARIWFPWKLKIGSNAGIGFDALIYNQDTIEIGDFATISQRAHINTGSHDYLDPKFPLVTRPVHIGAGAFIGADSFVGWGVRIGEMAVIGARSVVVSDMPPYTVCVGHPCKPIKAFEIKAQESDRD